MRARCRVGLSQWPSVVRESPRRRMSRPKGEGRTFDRPLSAKRSASARGANVIGRTPRARGRPAAVNPRHGTDDAASWQMPKGVASRGRCASIFASASRDPAPGRGSTAPGDKNPMSNRRVAIVAGCRTPFVRSGTVFRDLTAVDLGEGLRPRAARAHGGRSRLGRHAGHGAGGPLGQGPEPRPRGRSRGRAAEVGSRPHRQPRLRLREPGDRRRGVVDPARPRWTSGSPAGPRASPTCRSCTAGAWRASWWRRRRRSRSAPGWRVSRGCGRATSCRTRRPSPSRPPA